MFLFRSDKHSGCYGKIGNWQFLLSYYAPNFEKVGDTLVSACPYVCVWGGEGIEISS